MLHRQYSKLSPDTVNIGDVFIWFCSEDWLLGRFNFTLVRLVAPGAYETPKVAKERVTAVYALIKKKYKIKPATVSILGKCTSSM